MLKALVRVRLASLKAGFFRNSRSGTNKHPGLTMALFAFLMLYVFAAFVVMFLGVFGTIAEPYHDAGLGWLYFALYGLLSFGIMLVGTVFTAKSQLYEARDNELLLSMPIPPSYILASRMGLLLLMNLLFELAIAIPAGLCWFTRWFDPVAFGSFLIVFLLLPFFSLAVTALLAWLISMITSRMRNKTLCTMIVSLAFFAAYFWGIQKMQTGIALLAVSGEAIATALSGFSPLLWLGLAASQGDLWALLLCVLFLAVPFALATWLLSATFLKTAGTRRGAKKLTYRGDTSQAKSAPLALLGKELRRFGASAVWMLNGGLGAVFLLVGGVLLMVKPELLNRYLAAIPGAEPCLPIALGAIACLLTGFVAISSCAVSLEGKNLWLLKSLPIEPWEILRAKSRLHILIFLPALLVAWVGILVAITPDPLTAALLLLMIMAFNCFVGDLGVMLNLRHPMLVWVNESQPVKSGVALLLSMLIGSLLPLALGAGCCVLILGELVSPLAATAILAALFLLLAFWQRRRLRVAGPALWATL